MPQYSVIRRHKRQHGCYRLYTLNLKTRELRVQRGKAVANTLDFTCKGLHWSKFLSALLNQGQIYKKKGTLNARMWWTWRFCFSIHSGCTRSAKLSSTSSQLYTQCHSKTCLIMQWGTKKRGTTRDCCKYHKDKPVSLLKWRKNIMLEKPTHTHTHVIKPNTKSQE